MKKGPAPPLLPQPDGGSTPLEIITDKGKPTVLLPMSAPDDLASVVTLTLE